MEHKNDPVVSLFFLHFLKKRNFPYFLLQIKFNAENLLIFQLVIDYQKYNYSFLCPNCHFLSFCMKLKCLDSKIRILDQPG